MKGPPAAAPAPVPSHGDVSRTVLRALVQPGRTWLLALALLAGGVAIFFLTWLYQVKTGMGVAGLNHPVGWGTYITSFVFWVGIAHSGTLISAILKLLRTPWRASVARAAEAMTVFAVMTAGLFPLIHLGRFWVFYYLVPYPSQRGLWPDFRSALVWDLVAVLTYFTVSTVFFLVGTVPDVAEAREVHGQQDRRGWRYRLYRVLAVGWEGSSRQWHHYGRSYLLFAALATPLVISVHSVVSWDFAVGLLPGWHSTVFAPYFVAGAIHSGLAMVLTLLIPLRRWLRLERVLTPGHFDAMARTMLVTTAILAWSYAVEHFGAWYTGEVAERQFLAWRAWEGWVAPFFWLMLVLVVLVPLAFAFRRVRASLRTLWILSVLVNVGMWIERLVIVAGSTSHDFLPHAFGSYAPTWVELTILGGSFSFFLLWFTGFAGTLPVVGTADVKETLDEERLEQARAHRPEDLPVGVLADGTGDAHGVVAVYRHSEELLSAMTHVAQSSWRRVVFWSPFQLPPAERMIWRRPSVVRFWTFGGALAGLTGGYGLAVGASLDYALIAGGKHPISLVPYTIVGFEGMVLVGTLATLAGMLVHGRLRPGRQMPDFQPGFLEDRFGLRVSCGPEEAEAVRVLLGDTGGEVVHGPR